MVNGDKKQRYDELVAQSRRAEEAWRDWVSSRLARSGPTAIAEEERQLLNAMVDVQEFLSED